MRRSLPRRRRRRDKEGSGTSSKYNSVSIFYNSLTSSLVGLSVLGSSFWAEGGVGSKHTEMTFLNPSKTSLSFLLSNNLFICVVGNVFVMELLPRELRADCAASRVSSRAKFPTMEIRCMFLSYCLCRNGT